ncbi:helix-turn-helix domain-containing protein [Streptomyces sp. NPDC002845]
MYVTQLGEDAMQRPFAVQRRYYARGSAQASDLGKAALPSLVARGMTNVQVARGLSLSRHTVAFHLRKVFRMLDVSSRVELAHMWGTRAG